MAIVKGPLHSVRAQGKFGKSITYRKHASGTVAVTYYTPSGDKTAPQHSQRQLMKDARAAWRALDAESQTLWNHKANRRIGVSGYNLFIQNYFNTHEPVAAPTFDSFTFDTRTFA